MGLTPALNAAQDTPAVRLDAVVEAAADALFTTDEHGIIETFNRAACRMFGYAAEEVIGRDSRLLVLPGQGGQYDAELSRYLEAGVGDAPGICHEVSRRRKDGSTIPLEVHVSILRVAERRHIVSVCRDVSERKVTEAQLAALNEHAVEVSRQAGMAELATGVLHNVGNILNSVNVSTNLLAEKLQKSKVGRVSEIANLLREHGAGLGDYLSVDEKGKVLPGYLEKLGKHLAMEHASLLAEVMELTKNIDRIKTIVQTQQARANVFGVVESASLADIANDALAVNASSLDRCGIRVVREYSDTPPVAVDKTRVLQILVNLVRNAKEALQESEHTEKQLNLRMQMVSKDHAQFDVIDNGIGITEENLAQLFSYGFTTKPNANGHGLHNSALAAKELGGALTARSEGVGRGATFTLLLPVRAAVIVQGIPLKMAAVSPISAACQ